MKIAVPVKDESLEIFTRTGRAPYFAIFECDDECKLIELAQNTHAKEHENGHHHEEHTQEEINHHHRHLKASKVADCDYIVVRALGPNMQEALKLAGVKPIKVSKSDGDNALEVLKKVIKGLK